MGWVLWQLESTGDERPNQQEKSSDAIGGPRHDGVWRESGIVRSFPADGPKLLWRAPIHRGYAGPSVADGRILVFGRKAPQSM